MQPAENKIFTVLKTAIVEALNYSGAPEAAEALAKERGELEDVCAYLRGVRGRVCSLLELLH